MIHSNTHSYPLPFPNEAQRMQVASYSSLANALGTDPGHDDRQERTPQTTCDAATDNQGIYLDRPSINNAFYPYPVRNVLNPGTYLARIPLSMPNKSNPNNASIIYDERTDAPGFSSRYARLPQPHFVDLYDRHTRVEFPAVHFLRKGGKEPYSLWDLLTMDTMPDLVDGDAPIFVQSPDRWIKIKLTWPGYSRYPFEKRIPIKREATLTPSLLLMVLAYDIEKFVRWIHSEGAIVEQGQEYWTVTEATGGGPPVWKNCVITSLQHRAGSIWQPEIYYPRR